MSNDEHIRRVLIDKIRDERGIDLYKLAVTPTKFLCDMTEVTVGWLCPIVIDNHAKEKCLFKPGAAARIVVAMGHDTRLTSKNHARFVELHDDEEILCAREGIDRLKELGLEHLRPAA
jgi:hypothetical protein